MLDLYKKLYNTLKDDVTIQSYVDTRVYMAEKPVVQTPSDYPQITIRVNMGDSRHNFNVYYCPVNISVWSKKSQTETQLIGKRIIELLDGNSFTEGSFQVFRMHKESAPVLREEDTEVWHLSLNFEAIITGYGFIYP